MIREIQELLYDAVNETVRGNIKELGTIKVNCKLGEILNNRGISQKDFSALTGLREGTVSEFKNLKKLNINMGTLVVIMATLKITDIRDIIDIEFG